MTFAQALAAWSDDRLAGLLTLRPDLMRPVPKTLASLIERSTHWMSIQQCRWELDRGAQQVLDALCLIQEPKALGSLVALLGGSTRAVGLEDVLARLEDRALVLRSGDTLLTSPGLAGIQYPARLGPPASSALASYHASGLATMARKLGVRPGPTRASALAAVCAAISDPGRLRLVLTSGPADCARIAHMAAHEGPMVTARNGVYALSDRSPAGWLAGHGVLAPMSWDTLVMPREVALVLRGGTAFPRLDLLPPEVATESVDPNAVDSLAAERALRLAGDVRIVLDLWGQVGPTVLKDGGIGVRELRRVARVLQRPEPEAALVVEIAAAAGLVSPARPAGAVLPLPAYDQWLALEVPQRWERLVEGWLNAELHPSLAGTPDHKERAIPALAERAPERHACLRRRIVLDILAAVPSGQAVSVPSLAARADWWAPDVWAGGPALSQVLRSWVVLEAEALGVVALGALSSFGRLAVSAPTAPAPAVRDPAGTAPTAPAPAVHDPAGTAPNAAGSAARALAPWAPVVSTSFVVQADLTAVAPGELSASVRTELELLAEVESKGAATVYRFDEASLRRGFDAGRTVAQIMGFLEQHSTRAVPQSLVYLVGDLGRRFGNLRVGEAGCYVRCDDPALIAEILAARRNAKLGLRCLAPTVLVSGAGSESTLGVLRNSGYLAALEDGEGSLAVVDVTPRRAAPAGARPSEAAGLDPGELISSLRKAQASGGPTLARERVTRDVAGQLEPRPAWPHVLPDLPPGLSESVAASLTDLMGEIWQDRPSRPDQGPSLPEGPPVRPVEIVRGGGPAMELLRRAYDAEWMVRVGYRGRNGRTSQVNCTLLAIDDDHVIAECEPGRDERVVSAADIEWVRVLTEAEEAMPL